MKGVSDGKWQFYSITVLGDAIGQYGSIYYYVCIFGFAAGVFMPQGQA